MNWQNTSALVVVFALGWLLELRRKSEVGPNIYSAGTPPRNPPTCPQRPKGGEQ